MKNFIDTEFTTVTQDGQETRVPDLGGVDGDSDVRYSVMDRGDGTCLVRVGAPEAKMQTIVDASATSVVTDDNAESDLSANRPRATHENLDVPDPEVDALLNEHTHDEVLDSEEKLQIQITLGWSKLSREDRVEILGQNGYDDPRALVINEDEATMQGIVDSYPFEAFPSHLDTATVARAAVQLPSVGKQTLQDQEVTAMNKAAKAKSRTDCDKLSKNSFTENTGEIGPECKCILEGKNKEHCNMLDYVKGKAGTPWASGNNPPAVGQPENTF